MFTPRFLAALLLPLSLCATRAAHAQQYWPQERPEVPVGVYAKDRTLQLRVVPNGSKEAIAICSGGCDFWALPGRYTLYTQDLKTGTKHQQSLRIKDSRRYLFDQGDEGAAGAGLALGVGGSIAFVAGLFMTLPLVLSSMCEDTNCTSDTERATGLAGLGLLAAGAVATPIGWTMYAHNRPRLTPFDDQPYARNSDEPSVRLGLVGVSGGIGLGGVARF